MKKTHLMIHHSAGRANETIEEIDRAHRAQGWRMIGYHYVVVRKNGRGYLKAGRPVADTGAHAGVSKWNRRAIGLCVVGYFHPGCALSEHMDEQLYADVLGAVLHLMRTHSIPAGNLLRHRDVKATACPGEWFPWDRLLRDVQEALT